MQQQTKPRTLKQPKVFPFSLTVAAFERFGYYVLAFLLVLYTKSAFHLSDHAAFILYGTLTALVFLTPAAGGYLADNIIGIKRTMVLGLIFESTGLALVASPNKWLFLLALSFIIIGVGFFKVGPTNLMGRSYQKNDPRIDSGFTIYYMAMNALSLFSPIAAGIIQRYFGWPAAFLLGAIVLYFNLLVFFIMRHRTDGLDTPVSRQKLSKKTKLYIAGGLIATACICILLLGSAIIADLFFFISAFAIFIYFAYEISKSPRDEKSKIIACVSLIIMAMVFFIMYNQLYMSMTLFLNRSVRHNVFGYSVPTVFYLSLNGFWIVVLSPLLVLIYNFLGRKKKDLHITTKFPLGILIASFCFFSLTAGTYFPDVSGQISGLWFVLAMFFYSLGELLVSALGVAMVTRIAPKRMYGVMMGAWFFIGMALSSKLAGSISTLADIPGAMRDHFAFLHVYGRAFFEIGLGGAILAVVAFFISPFIKRIVTTSE